MEPSPRSGLATIVPGTDIFYLLNQAVENLPATYGHKITGEPGLYTGGLRTMVDDCESGWVSDQGGNVVVTYDNVDFQEGIQSLVLTMNAAAGVGLLAHNDITPLDVSEYQNMALWMKPSILLATGDFELVLDNTAGCVSPEVTIDLRHPETLAAGVWKFGKPNDVSEYLPVDLTGVGTLRSIGIRQAVDKGAMNCKFDEINALRGCVWNKNNIPYSFLGSGPNLTQLKMNDRANMSMFYSTADYQKMEDFTIDGNLANQDAIDACSGIINRFGDYSEYENLFFHSTKGTGLNLRDVIRAVGRNIHGYNNENPVVAVSYCDLLDFDIYGRDTLNDDPLWAVRTNYSKFKVQATGGVGNLARIEGVSNALPSLNNEISVSGKDAPNAGLQIGSYAYGTDAKVQVHNCKYGVQVIANALGTRVGGTIWKPTEHAVICAADGAIFNGLNIFEPVDHGFLIYSDGVILNGCKALGTATSWSGMELSGALDTQINGGSFTGFLRAGHRGIKESNLANFTKARYVDISGNTFAASISGLDSIFRECKGLNPYGPIATPFDAVTNSLEVSGGAAVPVANTDYVVRQMDLMIKSTDSGNNNCAILIKDDAGATVIGPISDLLYPLNVPVGWKINWGAFTGADPTVQAGFN